MNKFSRAALLVLIIIVLIIIFIPVFGFIYQKIVNRELSGNFWGPDPLFFSGLLMSYAFFIPLLLTIFGGKKKYWIIIILVGLELLFFWGLWESFLIDLSAAIIGWILGELVLLIYRQLKVKK